MVSHSSLSSGTETRLGAVANDHGVNFALFSGHAEKVERCLFTDAGEVRMALPARTGDVWHGYLEGARPGLAPARRWSGPPPRWK